VVRIQRSRWLAAGLGVVLFGGGIGIGIGIDAANSVSQVTPDTSTAPQIFLAAPPSARAGESIVLRADAAWSANELVRDGQIDIVTSGAGLRVTQITNALSTGARVHATAHADGTASLRLLPTVVRVGSQPLVLELDITVVPSSTGEITFSADAGTATGPRAPAVSHVTVLPAASTGVAT